KKFEISLEEKDKAIDALKLEYAKQRFSVSSSSDSSTTAQSSATFATAVRSPSTSQNRVTSSTSAKKNLLSQCFDKCTAAISANPDQEIDDYLKLDVCLDDDADGDDIDVLEFWC
ncbi:unnamed protein product, partial [Rotaria sordida]